MRSRYLLLGLTYLFSAALELCAQVYPPRLKRSESFLGVHFDFHAGDDCTEVGRNVKQEMVAYILDTVKPHYGLCDCKRHPDRSSYPTKVGNQAPGFVVDPLRIWRQVTAERGVALLCPLLRGLG